MVDRTTGITDWDVDISNKLKKAQKPALLLVNKVDHELMESDEYDFYSLGLGDPIGLSAIQGRKIGDMLDLLVTHLKKVTLPPPVEDAIKLAVIGRENVGKSSFAGAHHFDLADLLYPR